MTVQDPIAAALDRYQLGPPQISSPGLEELAGEWAELHGSQSGGAPFSHPAWFRTWLRHFGADARPVFLAVHRDGNLIGVFPLTFDGRDASVLGDHNVSDYAGVCIAEGEEAAVVAAAIEWLVEDFSQSLTVWGVTEDSPLGAALMAAGDRFGWAVTCEEEAVSPSAEISGDWDAYLAGLKKKHRHELRRKLRNLEAETAIELAHATSGEDVTRGIEQLLSMMKESREDKSEFLTETMEAFFRDLGPAFAELGMVRLSTLLLDKQPAATVFAFEDEETIYLYNSGYDPERADLAVGLLSKALVLRSGISRGKSTFDFLRGNERYKSHLGGSARPVSRYVLRRSS